MMKNKMLAMMLVFLMILQLLPVGVRAEDTSSLQNTTVSSADTGTETDDTVSSNTLEAEWPETGTMNDDGSPVTAEQGDTAENSGAVENEADVMRVQDEQAEPATYTVTLDLDGGQLNSLHVSGWNPSYTSSYQWTRDFTEEQAGQGITIQINNTLGNLLPEKPYRTGYEFSCWEIDGQEVADAANINKDTVIKALWQPAQYDVSFVSSGSSENDPYWSIKVPYGATLWTDQNCPWKNDSVTWTDNTAAVSFDLNGNSEVVTVTRTLTNAAENSYYYTFTLGRVYYFTYGGKTPVKDGYHFVNWKMLSGGNDSYTVLGDTVFTAQFEAEKTYVFSIYFYNEDGTKATGADTQTITKTEHDIVNGLLSFHVNVSEIKHYTSSFQSIHGVQYSEVDSTITVDVNEAFGSSDSATNFLALSFIYNPEEIKYKVQYYFQNADNDDYSLGYETQSGNGYYGEIVPVDDRPQIQNVSFDGFLISPVSQSAVRSGVALVERNDSSVSFNNNTATIKVYYDRASYFIYFQTETTEAEISPVKVKYGSVIPDDINDKIKALQRSGYENVTEENVTWYHLDDSGELSEEQSVSVGSTKMPAHDLYAVVKWTPAKTSVRIVLWLESRNAASFQNAYTETVENVSTEARLTVHLNNGVWITGVGWPESQTQTVNDALNNLITEHYGDDKYTQFFSYSSENTKTSPGNVANASATETGNVETGGIQGESYDLIVNGDGSTTINVYYTRNIYTLEFILARENGGHIEVATNTPGTFAGAGWTVTQNTSFVFSDFASDTVSAADVRTEYGSISVTREYHLKEAESRDTRAAAGRFGTGSINGFRVWVYLLSARFEAEITDLWPSSDNIKSVGDYRYVSMGTASDSYYRIVTTNDSGQHNILNKYATMDQSLVSKGSSTSWNAESDPGNGTVAHLMVSYWSNSPSEYHYYFFYEALDTSVTSSDPRIAEFWPWRDDGNEYKEGQYVKWNGHVYIYSSTYQTQFSTSTRKGQNQPSRQGFRNAGVRYRDQNGSGDDIKGGNIYFFYTRETYTLDIQNVNGKYDIPDGLLSKEFDCLSDYQENAKTLQQLGWESVDDGKAIIRYGGSIAPLGESEVINWLTSTDGGKLSYPFAQQGENQYYFGHWYKNISYTVQVDWENDNEMKTMTSNRTLYAGWFTPRRTTTYTLNGGTWNDKVTYTLTTAEIEGETVYIYYSHMANSGDATVYWYMQTKENDRLFVNELYTCKLSEIAAREESTAHWQIKDDLKINDMLSFSSLDTTGTRLINVYYCYMGGGGQYSHEKYVNINAEVGSVLSEPKNPSRNGYSFSGWYYFEQIDTATAEKTYLRNVLLDDQDLSSYDEGYVYLNHVQDAFLLHKDSDGQLYYYADQTGYRFSYDNEASVVSSDLQLYAAWTPTGDATGVVYHLVKKAAADGLEKFQADDKTFYIDQYKTILINNTEYYILEENTISESLYTGSTYRQTGYQSLSDNNGRIWLPEQAEIDLHIDDSTPTVTSEDDLNNISGFTYRMQDSPDSDKYTYYVFFIYDQTNQVQYNVYAIDLAVAVAERELLTYQDTFDRNRQIDENASYVLRKEKRTVDINDLISTTIVTENAPEISGYSVYRDGTQELQLSADPDTNNIYFYYVHNDRSSSYSITFYVMSEGKYSLDNTVKIENIPAATGEIIPINDMAGTYHSLIMMAQEYQKYANSEIEAQKDLYERYQSMTISYKDKTFAVGGSNSENVLDLSEIEDFYLDYYVESYSPTGENLVVSNGTNIDVYLASASLVVNKQDASGNALSNAVFTLKRLVENETGEYSFNGKNYSVDSSFAEKTAESGSDGKAVFYDLSARVFEDGTGYLYLLQETKAPDGYYVLGKPIYVTTPYTVEGRVYYSVTYTVIDNNIQKLPNAGIFGGVYGTILLGGGMITAAILGVLLVGKRKKK